MAADTFNRLVQFAQKHLQGTIPAVDYNRLRGAVDSFNRARTPAEKRAALNNLSAQVQSLRKASQPDPSTKKHCAALLGRSGCGN
jgi:hypothetical protein